MNRINLEPTKFVNQRTGITTFGFRMYDDNTQTYSNTWDSIPEDDMEVLSKLMESYDLEVLSMLDFLLESSGGLYIGDVWYEWDEIKHLWESEKA